ncbi:MAG: DEAD/DEAH box helicase family protein [Microthrixaceae bacterium]|nr:DEAD/DEAH box helicase family protein [Microthrixaceae bacterium]MCB1012131.1 DEAD/DEAH box helicase family protein [Microthrixaceae bacterium]
MPRPQTVIENPILNGPFSEPTRHFEFDEDGITDRVVGERRPSSYFVPIPKAKKKGGQLQFDTEWTEDRIESNEFINRVRARIAQWRAGGWRETTPTTRALLEYWTDPDRERPLFFCQIEALETAIYLTEAAKKLGDAWIENELRRFADDANPGLYRLAHKMATGTGKTVVMAMLIAWHTLNKAQNPQDGRFSDAFLVAAPGITIRDRLRVLLPSDPDNYYRERDIVPIDRVADLGRAKIVITNFHAFQLREKVKAPKLTKQLAGQAPGVFTETPDEMARRVCRELGTKKNIVVLNDEAHHCYRRRVTPTEDDLDKLTSEDKREAAKRDEEARVWISGLEAVAAKVGVKTVYDLSATPFYLRGSGWPEGTLFQWVVSDFSLIDAIESGLVKIPRVPVDDNAPQPDDLPTYRNLWLRIRDDLPKKGRRTDAVDGTEPRLPGPLEGAIQSLYGNYEQSFQAWELTAADGAGSTPPVFIVVCNNTNVSKLVFDYIAGWEKPMPDGGTVVVPGQLPLFSNEAGGGWSTRPTTILVDSTQLESGEAMSAEFKNAARAEIDEFKSELRQRFPGRDVNDLTDEDLLREVMNTVGKPGKLGERIRCVVSVSMLTEGWDANTVTHVLGVRAFGTQLLCEQVVGRGLRRRSYALGDDGRFSPEYAEVYGVPFSFIPASGAGAEPQPGPVPTRVRALEDRIAFEITFPRLVGYRWEIPDEHLEADFIEESRLSLNSKDVPTRTDMAAVVGEADEHRLEHFQAMRTQEVAFRLAKRLLDRYFRTPDSDGQPAGERPWLFPTLVEIARRWVEECVTLADDSFIGLLAMQQRSDDAVEKLYQSIVRYQAGERRLVPIMRPYDSIGSTRHVDFDTTKDTYSTSSERCHVSHVVADSDWEAHLAGKLEHLDAVRSYVKNQGLGFTIPYAIDGQQRSYVPDFIVRLDDGQVTENSEQDLLNLIIEVSGAGRRDKATKVATARNLWIPAVNNHRKFGRWAFIEVTDPWEAAGMIEAVARGEH